MTPFAPLTTASRALVTAVIAAVFLLGAASVAAHPGDGCNDEFCTTLQCDMAAGNGCGSLCLHTAAAPAGAKLAQLPGAVRLIPGRDSGPGLRLLNRPFRPPALS